MYYVYYLENRNKNYHYIGITHDLKNRLIEHNRGKVESTKPHTPLFLLYYEAYQDKRDAYRREHNLKHSGGAAGNLKRRLHYSLGKL